MAREKETGKEDEFDGIAFIKLSQNVRQIQLQWGETYSVVIHEGMLGQKRQEIVHEQMKLNQNGIPTSIVPELIKI